MDVPSYIHRVSEALQQEEARCAQYLSSGTKPKLVRVVLVECVVAHADHIFDAARDMLWAMYDNSQVQFSSSFVNTLRHTPCAGHVSIVVRI